MCLIMRNEPSIEPKISERYIASGLTTKDINEQNIAERTLFKHMQQQQQQTNKWTDHSAHLYGLSSTFVIQSPRMPRILLACFCGCAERLVSDRVCSFHTGFVVKGLFSFRPNTYLCG